jgi:hypothetical protein
MLNLWRGFGVEPRQGDWSLMRAHILKVICRGDHALCDYVINWMAYGVQHPDRPVEVNIATRGGEGAGKGFMWRNYGKLFGKHFKHIVNGEHLTGRFNGVLGDACAVFLDEALWAGDRKGEQVLKALTTEDTFQLERKFCDPIPVKNRVRIMIASNNDWIVPVGPRGRRNVVLDVSDEYTDENDPKSKAYWEPLQAQFGNYAPDDGRAAMLYDLLHKDLSGFNIRAVPRSAAKTEQKLLSLHGTMAWLFSVLQDGAVEIQCSNGSAPQPWTDTGLVISKTNAYQSYQAFSKQRHEWQPEIKDLWSKKIRAALGQCIRDARPEGVRSFQFASLAECRRQFASHLGDPDLEWEEPDDQPPAAVGETAEDVGADFTQWKLPLIGEGAAKPHPDKKPDDNHEDCAAVPGTGCKTETEQDYSPEYDPTDDAEEDYSPEYDPTDHVEDAPDIEWDPQTEPEYCPEHEPDCD